MRISKLGLLSDFLNVVNRHLKETITPGDRITLSESMVKSFHKGLKKGTKKIIRKPRPNGNEFKKGADARSNIITHLELYERKYLMAEKDHIEEYGATTAIV